MKVLDKGLYDALFWQEGIGLPDPRGGFQIYVLIREQINLVNPKALNTSATILGLRNRCYISSVTSKCKKVNYITSSITENGKR